MRHASCSTPSWQVWASGLPHPPPLTPSTSPQPYQPGCAFVAAAAALQSWLHCCTIVIAFLNFTCIAAMKYPHAWLRVSNSSCGLFSDVQFSSPFCSCLSTCGYTRFPTSLAILTNITHILIALMAAIATRFLWFDGLQSSGESKTELL